MTNLIHFNNKGFSHLIASIGASETEIRVAWNDYLDFIVSDADAGDLIYAILRDPVDREIVAIDIFNSVSGVNDKYLKVTRAQGGTNAKAWPEGTLIFLSTHADHYGALFQPDGTRQIDFNPNGALSPNYAGEKVLQYAGCAVRWWMSFDAVNPYWHLIAGEPCDAEDFTDPGWGFKVWFDTTPVCWEPYFDDTKWAPANPTITFNGTVWNSNGYFLGVILDPPLGTWRDGYRPVLMRITRPVEEMTLVKLENLSLGDIINETVPVGPDGHIFQAGGYLSDIRRLTVDGDIGGVTEVSGIDFFECDQETVESDNSDGRILYIDADWATARDSASGEGVSDSQTREAVGAWFNTNYFIYRNYFNFDLTGVTIANIHSAMIRFHLYSYSSSGAPEAQWIIQEAPWVAPLDLPDYSAGTGPPLADVQGWEGIVGWVEFFLNAAGIAWLKTKLGGQASFVLREYAHDYLDVPPVLTTQVTNFHHSEYSTVGYRPTIFLWGL